jgi:hypothetical protein
MPAASKTFIKPVVIGVLALSLCALIEPNSTSACEEHGVWHKDCYPSTDDTTDDRPDRDTSSPSAPVTTWNPIQRWGDDLKYKEQSRRREAYEQDIEARAAEFRRAGDAAMARGDFRIARDLYYAGMKLFGDPERIKQEGFGPPPLNGPGASSEFHNAFRELERSREAAISSMAQRTFALSQEGVALFNSGDFRGALAKLVAAARIIPDPWINQSIRVAAWNVGVDEAIRNFNIPAQIVAQLREDQRRARAEARAADQRPKREPLVSWAAPASPGLAKREPLVSWAAPASPGKDPIVRREPPSPRVTSPTTLSELRQQMSDNSRWVIDHVQRVLDGVPIPTAEKIRERFVHQVSDRAKHAILGENGQRRWDFDMATKDDAQNVLEAVRSDLRQRGQLDQETADAIDQMERNIRSRIREGLR